MILIHWLFFQKKLKKLKNNLKTLLSELLKENSYYESLIFRGVYFTGKSEKYNDNIFTKKLFTNKIFSEFGLARPLVKTMKTSKLNLSKATIGIAAVLLIWLIGIVFSAIHLNMTKKNFIPLMEKAGVMVQQHKSIDKNRKIKDINEIKNH